MFVRKDSPLLGIYINTKLFIQEENPLSVMFVRKYSHLFGLYKNTRLFIQEKKPFECNVCKKVFKQAWNLN